MHPAVDALGCGERTIWQACTAPFMGAIFSDMDGLEDASPLVLRRTLLELAAVRRAVEGVDSIPLGQLLEDAGLSSRGREASLALRAAAQNNVVFVDHQEMYNTPYLGPYTHLYAAIECNPRLVEKWVSRAGGGPGAHTFGAVPQNVRDAMIGELDGRIDQLKGRLPGSHLDDSRGCYVRGGGRAG